MYFRYAFDYSNVLFPKNKKILTVWTGHKYVLVALKIYRCPRTAAPEKREYLGKWDNLNFKEKSPISSDNREKILRTSFWDW
jgi:hypothetical protein